MREHRGLSGHGRMKCSHVQELPRARLVVGVIAADGHGCEITFSICDILL